MKLQHKTILWGLSALVVITVNFVLRNLLSFYDKLSLAFSVLTLVIVGVIVLKWCYITVRREKGEVMYIPNSLFSGIALINLSRRRG